MKPGLKRIEATLNQLRTISTTSHPEPDATREAHAPQTRDRTYSFEIRSAAQKRNAPEQNLSEALVLPFNHSVQPFTAKKSSGSSPTLPKFNLRFSKRRQVAKPALAMKPLKEIQTDAAACEAQLQQILQQIQDIYLEGPIVDGWLESHPPVSEPSSAMRRSGEVNPLVDYVKEVCSFEQGKVTCESPRVGYRLCGRDAAGQMWSLPCPLDQLPSVSIAIARYQKLQQLLDRKQYLETRLSKQKS